MTDDRGIDGAEPDWDPLEGVPHETYKAGTRRVYGVASDHLAVAHKALQPFRCCAHSRPDRLPLLVGGFVSFFTDAASNEGSGIDGAGGTSGGGTTAAGTAAAGVAGTDAAGAGGGGGDGGAGA